LCSPVPCRGEASMPALNIREGGRRIQKRKNLVTKEMFGNERATYMSVANSVCGYTQRTLCAQSLWCIYSIHEGYTTCWSRGCIAWFAEMNVNKRNVMFFGKSILCRTKIGRKGYQQQFQHTCNYACAYVIKSSLSEEWVSVRLPLFHSAEEEQEARS
jgi:hypothetical protein